MTFTLDELLAHLREEPEPPEGYLTTVEWAQRFEIPKYRMQELLREAFEADILLRNEVYQERYDGQRQLVKVYSFRLEDE